MATKKQSKKKNKIMIPLEDANFLEEQYIREIENDPRYSLVVDEKNRYKFTEEEKRFILNFVQYKSVATAAEMTGIDMNYARECFQKFETQQEIRRLNSALYHRQFSAKLLNLDAIGGYLSSLLMDLNIPYADRLKSSDKLKVVDMLVKVNELKSQSIMDPTIIMSKDISEEIKDLSIETIQSLLAESDNLDKVKLIESIGENGGLTIEESAYLETLSTHELLQILEKIKGEK